MSEQMQLIICTFDATDRAEEVEQIIQTWDRRLDTIKLGNVAIVQKTPDGQISFRETRDIRSEVTEIAGEVFGEIAALIYAVAGSLGAVAGPMAGFFTQDVLQGLVRDMGFPDEALQAIGERLDVGSSALLTLVRSYEQPLVVAQLEQLGGKIVEHIIPPEIIARLKREA